MRRHLAYLKYVLRHKYSVFKIGRQMGISFWRLIKHDMTKFMPCEFIPYAHSYYDKYGNSQYKPHDQLNLAWCHHQQRNAHHWQYWVLLGDDGSFTPLPIPVSVIREMVADIIAMESTDGRSSAIEYYESIEHKIMFHAESRTQFEYLLKIYAPK